MYFVTNFDAVSHHTKSRHLDISIIHKHIVWYGWHMRHMMIWYIVWYGTAWSMIWYDMIWYDIWYDMIYDMIWYDIWYHMIYDIIWYMIYDIWYDMIWHDMTWHDMIYDMIWCDVMWCDVIWYDMIWYDMTLLRCYLIFPLVLRFEKQHRFIPNIYVDYLPYCLNFITIEFYFIR